MAGSNIKDTDRSVILTRFILLYIVSILCAIIPLYYLLNIPDMAIGELKASKLSAKGQKEQIEGFIQIYTELEQYKEKNQFLKEYTYLKNKLYNFAKDSVGNSNLYKPLFLKVSDLYEFIQKMNENSTDKATLDKCKAELENMEKEKKDVDEKLNDCKVQLGICQGSHK